MTAASAAQARRTGVCSGLIRLDFYLPSSLRLDSDMSATLRGSGRVGGMFLLLLCVPEEQMDRCFEFTLHVLQYSSEHNMQSSC